MKRSNVYCSTVTLSGWIGRIYDGRVAKNMDFGTFENVRDGLSEGDEVRVKVLDVDKQGGVKLSIKAVNVSAATD